jgi:hypothetical protein
MQTIKKNWSKWLVMVAVSASMFFGGLALRLRITTDRLYVKGAGFLMMFLGLIMLGTMLVVFVKKFLGENKPKL